MINPEDVDWSAFLEQWPQLAPYFPKPKPKEPAGPKLTVQQAEVMSKLPMLRKKEWMKVDPRVRKAPATHEAGPL
jgi:hypothetical protein